MRKGDRQGLCIEATQVPNKPESHMMDSVGVNAPVLGSLRAADSSSTHRGDTWSKRCEHIDIAENSRPALLPGTGMV